MTLTRPTGEQLRFRSAKTGDHILDTYLEAAELGGRTLSDLLADLFNHNSGEFRDDLYEWRITNDGEFQFRVGDHLYPEDGWRTLVKNPTLFGQRGLYAPGTLYRRTDIVHLDGKTYLCRVEHTATTPEPDPAHFTTIVDATLGYGLIYSGDTPPPSPAHGQLWLDTRSMSLRAYYDDGTSQQWVDPASPPKMQALAPAVGAQNIITLTVNWTGTPPAGETVRIPIAHPFALAANFAGSLVRWGFPPSDDYTITLSNEDAVIGTITIHPNETTTFTSPAPFLLVAGDTLLVQLQNAADASLSGLALTLKGTI